MTANRQMAMTTQAYASPLGTVVLAADDLGLTGLWFEGQKYFGHFGSTGLAVDRNVADAVGDTGAHEQAHRTAGEHIAAACVWLNAYFAGKRPPETPLLHLLGTPFQLEVWNLLLAIPYGQTTSYGALAHELERQRVRYADPLGQRPDGQYPPRTSARAVGGAVGRNPVSIIVPCHRVLGANGSITGYAGGLERKKALLALEQRR